MSSLSDCVPEITAVENFYFNCVLMIVELPKVAG
jgi:hypothetical protein